MSCCQMLGIALELPHMEVETAKYMAGDLAPCPRSDQVIGGQLAAQRHTQIKEFHKYNKLGTVKWTAMLILAVLE